MYSCSSVTYAPAGSIPEPMNLFGALVVLRQSTAGSTSNPRARPASRIRAWFGWSWNRPPRVRTASPMLMHAMPPSISTRCTCDHTRSRSRCISSKAAAPSFPSSAWPMAGSRARKCPSHIAIIG
ncbi:MAG: hypothetical protein A2177_04560 [Spirochaetes bacterium RBG_13_68_11]|nr:MAG: hypothetical protein A2177_04560 [Spirochaetes bacterium RBG_13_68_11]